MLNTKSSFLIVANLKSHQTLTEFKAWLTSFKQFSLPSNTQLIVAPSYPHLYLTTLFKSSTKQLKFSAQDCSPFPRGSYTGAVNVDQLLDFNINYCLVGHSERRRYFHETPTMIANKVSLLVQAKITPIICLSKHNYQSTLSAIEDKDLTNSIFAYEPPADIGGTETAPPADIKQFVTQLKQRFHRPVLYGGSVNQANLHSLLNLNLNGLLIGTASLDPKAFLQFINHYSTLRS